MRRNCERLTDVELETMIKDQQRAQIRFTAQVNACKRIVTDLEMELVSRRVARKRIKYGDIVTVIFRNGRERVRFEGVELCRWAKCPQILLRSFTTRGKPFKQAHRYAPDVLDHITRKEQSNG